jgi:hypothetical protein
VSKCSVEPFSDGQPADLTRNAWKGDNAELITIVKTSNPNKIGRNLPISLSNNSSTHASGSACSMQYWLKVTQPANVVGRHEKKAA